MVILIVIVTITAVIGFMLLGATWLIARFRPNWSRRRIILIGAALVPLFFALLLAALFIELLIDNAQRPDTLNDAGQRVFGVLLFFIAPVVSALCAPIGFFAGWLVTRHKKGRSSNDPEVFE